jgi:hypothetical protein
MRGRTASPSRFLVHQVGGTGGRMQIGVLVQVKVNSLRFGPGRWLPVARHDDFLLSLGLGPGLATPRTTIDDPGGWKTSA